MRIVLSENKPDVLEVRLKQAPVGCTPTTFLIGQRNSSDFVIAEITEEGVVEINPMGVIQLRLSAPQLGIKEGKQL